MSQPQIPTMPVEPVVVPNGARPPSSAPDEATRAAGRKQTLVDNVRRERLAENAAPPLAMHLPEPPAFGVWITGSGWLRAVLGNDLTVFASELFEVAQSAARLANAGRLPAVALPLFMDKSMIDLEKQFLDRERWAGEENEHNRLAAIDLINARSQLNEQRERDAHTQRMVEARRTLYGVV